MKRSVARPISILPLVRPPCPKYRIEILSAAAFRELAARPKQERIWREFGALVPDGNSIGAIVRRDGHIMFAGAPCHVEGKARHYAEIVLAGLRTIPAIIY